MLAGEFGIEVWGDTNAGGKARHPGDFLEVGIFTHDIVAAGRSEARPAT